MLGEKLLYFLFAVGSSEELLHLYLTLKLHQPVEHRFRARRASGNIHINRKNLIHTGAIR